MTSNVRKNGGLFKYMGFDLILAGALFMFNPDIGVADFLPDLIGWALIAAGMYRLRDMGDDLAAAYDRVRKLLIVSAARFVMMILVPGMEDKGYSLVFTFIFCAAEAGLMDRQIPHPILGQLPIGFCQLSNDLGNGFFAAGHSHGGKELAQQLIHRNPPFSPGRREPIPSWLQNP